MAIVTDPAGLAALTKTEDGDLDEDEEGDKTLEIRTLDVKVYGNDIEKALKILKRNLLRDGLFREIRNRKYYEKPSVKKKRKQVAARRNRRKMGFPS